MVLLHGINDNIIIPYPFYLDVYQNEAKMRALKRDKYFLELEQNKTKQSKGGARFSVNIWNKIK